MKNKNTIIGLIIFILTLGVGGYFMFGKKKKTDTGSKGSSGEDMDSSNDSSPIGYDVEPYLSKWYLKRFSREQFLQRIEQLASKPAWVEKQRQKASASNKPLGKQMVASAYWYLKNRP